MLDKPFPLLARRQLLLNRENCNLPSLVVLYMYTDIRSASCKRIGDHNWVAQELEFASTCMAAKPSQAGCENASKKSQVLSSSVSVRAKLQIRLTPLGLQATSGKRARLEKSKGRVKRIRKIHGRSSVPLRRRPAQIAHTSVSKANHNGVAATGPNETHWQQPRFPLSSHVHHVEHGTESSIDAEPHCTEPGMNSASVFLDCFMYCHCFVTSRYRAGRPAFFCEMSNKYWYPLGSSRNELLVPVPPRCNSEFIIFMHYRCQFGEF